MVSSPIKYEENFFQKKLSMGGDFFGQIYGGGRGGDGGGGEGRRANLKVVHWCVNGDVGSLTWRQAC